MTKLYWHRTDYDAYPSDYKLMDNTTTVAATDGYFNDDGEEDISRYSIAVWVNNTSSAIEEGLPGEKLLAHLESISEAFCVSNAELHEVWRDNE